MSNEPMKFVVDWSLPQAEFRDLIRGYIQQCEKSGKVLVLPMAICPGQPFLDLLTIMLSEVNCTGCAAPCCRRNPDDSPITLPEPEYARLAAQYGAQHFRHQGAVPLMDMPCPFLRTAAAPPFQDLCRIYPDRPLACVLFPFQTGANDDAGHPMIALASSCPEARRITRQVYMTGWRIRRQYHALGHDLFLERLFGGDGPGPDRGAAA
jgi:Fe-S-cluster containining protein